jgi:Bacterial RNA polymerase, alpha chain C terminal domain
LKQSTVKTPANQPASDLPKLSAPAQRALAGAGISNLKQLSKFTEADIKKLHGIGPNAIKELQAALKAKGLAFNK